MLARRVCCRRRLFRFTLSRRLAPPGADVRRADVAGFPRVAGLPSVAGLPRASHTRTGEQRSLRCLTRFRLVVQAESPENLTRIQLSLKPGSRGRFGGVHSVSLVSGLRLRDRLCFFVFYFCGRNKSKVTYSSFVRLTDSIFKIES